MEVGVERVIVSGIVQGSIQRVIISGIVSGVVQGSIQRGIISGIISGVVQRGIISGIVSGIVQGIDQCIVSCMFFRSKVSFVAVFVGSRELAVFTKEGHDNK